MLETRARVISVQSDHAVVETFQQAGCGHCSTSGGCGSNTLSKLFCSSKPRSFLVSNPIAAVPGEEVIVALPEGALLRGVSVGYLLPLSGLLLGAWLGAGMSNEPRASDLIAAFCAVVGLAIGLLLGRRLARSNGRPYISRR